MAAFMIKKDQNNKDNEFEGRVETQVDNSDLVTSSLTASSNVKL